MHSAKNITNGLNETRTGGPALRLERSTEASPVQNPNEPAMPRIAEPDIERVKRDTDLLSLIQSRGVSLTRKGRNWTGLCPFHGDSKTPNLIVTPGKGLWRCMACGAAGNAIQFVQRHDGLSFRHAFELLANGGKAAFEGNGRAGPAKASTVPRLPCPLGEGSEGEDLLGEVAAYYHGRLAHSPPALDYLKARGLDDEGLCRRFRAGFADRTLGLRIPQANRKAGGLIRSRLKELGVLRSNGREHLHGCLVVPVTDMEGNTLQLYGRRVDPSAPKDGRHLYLPRPLAGVFNPEAFASRDLILCESILDAMTFARHGMDAATCAFGTGGMNDDLKEAIRSRKTETVRIAYDSDKAGEEAFARDAETLMKQGLEVLRVKLPWGADPNSFALDQGGEALKKAVRNAAWESSTGLRPVESGTGFQPVEPTPAAPPDGNPRPSSDKSQETASSPLVAKKAAKEAAKEAAPEPSAPEAAPPEAAKEKEISEPSAQSALPPSLERKGEHHEAAFGPASHLRRYRVTGLDKNSGLEALKITLRIEHDGLLHVDSIDLCRDADRRRFTDRAAEETLLEKDLLKRDLGKLLLMLEQAQEERLGDPGPTKNIVEMTPEEEQEALAFLQSPDLLERITQAYAASGVVGESREPAGGLPGLRLAQAPQAPRRHHPEHQRGREINAHGGRPELLPARGGREVLRHDRPEPLLHGRGRPEAQDPRHRRGGGGREGQLRPQAPPERGRADDSEHGEGPAQRPHGNPGVPRRGPLRHPPHHHQQSTSTRSS